MKQTPKNKKLVFLMGPTAAGKTDLAIELSKHLNTRLISVDSALIYKGMDIGTAKPDKQTLMQYPHYLVDICQPHQCYSAADFVRDAKVQIDLAFENNQVPILVGGTSFYFNALQYGLSDLPESTPISRQKIKQDLQILGVEKMHTRLQIIDPIAAQRIHPNDTQRITRALEVFDISGKTLSELQGNKQPEIDCEIKKIVLMPDRVELHARIEARFLSMMKAGFLQEVSKLKENTQLNEDLPSMRCVGYRQVWQYLDGKMDKTEMIQRAIIKTRQLCKAQSTWLNKEQEALFLKQSNLQQVLEYLV
jgi:tRNA dimethylallyltransferase